MNEYDRLRGNADDIRSTPGRQPPAWTGEWTLWLVVAAMGAHFLEEFALNFNGWALQMLHAPVSSEDFHLTNAAVAMYCIGCAAIGWRSPSIALSGAGIGVVNAIGFHTGSSLLFLAYTPGTTTSVLLFLPTAVVVYRAARKDGVLTRRALLVSLGVGVLWHLFMGGVFAIKYFAPLYP
ncbi:MAG: HXXEE domain-containing protein [Acidobacteriota bacterium]